MAEFKVSSSCVAEDDTKPEYNTSFELNGAVEICERFNITEDQLVQEAADNLARRITNGVRQIQRVKGAECTDEELDAYVDGWVPGRKSAASPLNVVKKMMKEAELTPEQSEAIEAIMRKMQKEASAVLEG